MATFEVCGDDGTILFLTCRIPDIKLGQFVMEIDVLDFKVDGGDLSLFLGEEVTLGKAPENGSLTHIAVSDQDELVLLLLPIGQIALLDHYFVDADDKLLIN